MSIWEVYKSDGYNRRIGHPVFVRAGSADGAEQAGKRWMHILGIKKVSRVLAVPYRPEMDRDFGTYIVRVEKPA